LGASGRDKRLTADETVAGLRQDATDRPFVLPPTVRFQGRGAVRAEDPQVLETVVVMDPVDVIEDHRDALPAPGFILSAELTSWPLEPSVVQALFEMAPGVARTLDQDPLKRNSPSSRSLRANRVRIEVI
jgi:hypothetical protein